MAAKVIEFQPPHTLCGPARCTRCGFEWEAVAQVGTAYLECPECGAGAGIFWNACLPAKEMLWQCGCGCLTFVVCETQIMCSKCGEAQRFG